MPRKRQPEPSEEPEVDPEVGIRLLNGQIKKGRDLLASRPLAKDAYSQWELLTRNCLEKAFGRGSPNVASVRVVGKYGGFPGNAGEQWGENHRASSLATDRTRV